MFSALLNFHTLTIGGIAALPWIIAPFVFLVRLARSHTLNEESADAPSDTPLVSIIIPARNEAHNIGECVRAIAASTYPKLEIIVIDDHSADGTGEIVREVARGDARVRVIDNPELPAGWFGKQWACQNGAAVAQGSIFIFVDADTRIASDLVTRSVNGMSRTGADLYTVLGRQEMRTFWERLVQPQMFTLLSARYGGTESINRSPRAVDKVANGQYLMLRRTAYEAMDGHALVRQFVAEDLMLAQRYFLAGRKTVVAMGWEQLSTRMYRSRREIVQGWGKNVFAGGSEAVPFGAFGQLLFPLALSAMPLVQLVPVLTLLVSFSGMVTASIVVWSAMVTAIWLIWWGVVYRMNGLPIVYALGFPIGAATVLYIFLSAIRRGRRVSWKGRAYVSVARS